jgi:hypothetical protein
MLTRTDFLSLVLPPKGTYCVVGLKDKKPRQVFFDTIEDVSDYADALTAKGYDSYFALASFNDGEVGRTFANANELKCFFLDIDCGPNKDYADQAEGLAATKEFVKAAKLPPPTIIVNSGRGVHVYWALEQAISKEEWKPLAEGLKALCATHKFRADPAVTADTARILRIPETLNFKDPENPQPTTVLMARQAVSIDKLKDLFTSNESALDIPGTNPFKRQLDATTLALMGNYEAKFKTILIKSMQGEGCAQIANAYENQDTIEEPLWRANLSIAQHCSDAGKAIHIISKGHPEYNASVTIKKASETKGPYTCATFKKLKPEICEGCQQKVTSPIQIGREIIVTDGEKEVVEVESVTKEEKVFVIPELPFPYFRGNNTGVYRRADPNREDDKDELVYAYDFYVVKRIHDPDNGETLLLRLHLPRDGVREFVVPLNSILSKEKFINAIAAQGMAVLGKKQDSLMSYVARWVEHLQSTSKSEIARKQFGWLEDNSAFIVGEREILATGEVKYSPPTAETLPILPILQPKGDFHIWKDIINAYGRDSMEGRAFAFFMGFGGPLMKFVGEGMLDGFLLNLISKGGGTGKTTLLYAINSIYGRPKELLLSYKDTHNHRLQRIGAMQSMTPTLDELTNLKPEIMSNLAYDITSGKGKNRMSSKANVERTNHTTWQIPVVSSSNRSIKDALLTIKSFPEAEMLRILEDRILADPYDDPTWSKAHFGRIINNYGHAIDPYIKYVASHLPECIELLNRVNMKIDRAAEIKNTERFWSAGAAIAITGGIIAKNLNLHDIPIEPVFQYVVNLIKNTRISNKESLGDSNDFLGGFLQKHFHEILVINGKLDKRTGLEMGAIREPRGPLTARYEPDTKLLFVVNKSYRDECGRQFLSYDDTLLGYKKNKAFLGVKKKRMMSGTLASATAGVDALVFDTSKLDFFNEEVFSNAEDNESSGED